MINKHYLVHGSYHLLNKNSKTFLFIEPYGAALSLLKRGILHGYNIIILTADSDLRKVPDQIVKLATLCIKINTHDELSLIQLVDDLSKIISISAVIPGFEYFVPIATKISHYLKLPSIDPQHILKLRRKDLMRKELQKASIRIPTFYLLSSIDELEQAIQQISFPAICKPVDASGSVHVKKVNNLQEATVAALRILEGNDVLWGYPLDNHLLLEEYIDGKEFSVEGTVSNGNITYFSITEKFVSDQTEFIEIGHIVNAPIDHSLKSQIETYISHVIKTLGMNFCPFHAEVRIDSHGPVLMEIAARLAGDKIGDLINLTSHVNYFDAIYDTYLGLDVSIPKTNYTYAGIRFFYRPEIEQYTTILGKEKAKKEKIEEIVFYYQPHVPIPSFPKPLRRLGHVIIKNTNYEELQNLLEKIDNDMTFCTS